MQKQILLAKKWVCVKRQIIKPPLFWSKDDIWHCYKTKEETKQPPSYDQVVLHDIIAQSQQELEEPPTYFESQGHI